MKKQTMALLDLSTLLSPVDASYDRSKEIIDSPETCWNEIIDFANQHLMIPALYSALQHKKLLDQLPDTLIIDYLTTVYNYNLERNRLIIVQLQEISDLLSEIDVRPVLLKGAAALSESYYHHLGARVMSDIDVLVPKERIHECIELFETKGEYKPVDVNAIVNWNSHQYKRIYSENGIAALELHYNNISKKYPYFANEDLMQHIRPSKIIKNAYVIEPSYDIYHIFLHSQIQDGCYDDSALNLRGLHHAAVNAVSNASEIRWDLPTKEAKRYNLTNAWNDYLYMLHRLFKIEIPKELIGSSEHFREILVAMEEHNAHEPWFSIFSRLFKRAFSYNNLKHKYKLKSRAGYPIAAIKYVGYLIKKYLFSSEARRRTFDFYKGLVTSKRFGR